MSRAAWLNALLAAAVAALGAWVYFKPASDRAVEFPLSAIEPGAAAAIRIERTGAPAMELAKKGDAWFLTAPIAARAHEARVQQVLELLQARAGHKLPATELGRFELDRPQARVTIAGQAFLFGMANEVTREQYVETGGAVYTVSPRYGAMLPARPADLISPRLFAANEAPSRIALPAFTVSQQDGKWTQQPQAPDLSQDDFVRWVDEWRRATAARVEPARRRNPTGEIRVDLKGGGTLRFGILAREPDLVLLRQDEKLQYAFPRATASRLLAPPGSRAGTAPAAPGGHP